MTPRADLDGMIVHLFRGEDGSLVVDIDTSGVADADEHGDGVPKLRVWINEQKIEVAPTGALIES